MRAAWVAFLGVLGCHASGDLVANEAALETIIECPASTRWNGQVCVWRYVVTDIQCPKLAVWDGMRCVSTHVSCPTGAAWDGERCVPIGQRPSEDEAFGHSGARGPEGAGVPADWTRHGHTRDPSPDATTSKATVGVTTEAAPGGDDADARDESLSDEAMYGPRAPIPQNPVDAFDYR